MSTRQLDLKGSLLQGCVLSLQSVDTDIFKSFIPYTFSPGNWTGKVPSCKEMNCPFNVDTNIFKCFIPYTFWPGNWTGKVPSCKEMYCPFPGTLNNGKILLVGNMGLYDYRFQIMRLCDYIFPNSLITVLITGRMWGRLQMTGRSCLIATRWSHILAHLWQLWLLQILNSII